MLSYDDIIKGEYIGRIVEVSYNNVYIDNQIEGLIVDETKNTFKILTKEGMKTYIKENIILQDKYNDELNQVNGKLLIGKPEDRLKKKNKKYVIKK